MGDLSSNDAVNEKGEKLKGETFTAGINIFEGHSEIDSNKVWLEDKDSNFDLHRTEVIKHSVETNLATAISQYQKYSTSEVSFQMPKLKDYEWELITNGISMITFMQGLSIGGKIYNGHAIVPNTQTEDFVSDESIRIVGNDGYYYSVTDEKLTSSVTPVIGLFNGDLERKTVLAYYNKSMIDEDVYSYDIKKNIYYYPRTEKASYSSIINPNNNTNVGKSIRKYLNGKGNLASIYYTALGRERYGIFRADQDETLAKWRAGLYDSQQ